VLARGWLEIRVVDSDDHSHGTLTIKINGNGSPSTRRRSLFAVHEGRSDSIGLAQREQMQVRGGNLRRVNDGN
jgi:hypothetical protein